MNTNKLYKAMSFHLTLIIDRDVGKKNKTLETGTRLPRVQEAYDLLRIV